MLSTKRLIACRLGEGTPGLRFAPQRNKRRFARDRDGWRTPNRAANFANCLLIALFLCFKLRTSMPTRASMGAVLARRRLTAGRNGSHRQRGKKSRRIATRNPVQYIRTNARQRNYCRTILRMQAINAFPCRANDAWTRAGISSAS